jgi:nucleotide-binding universal stress UspA family protein
MYQHIVIPLDGSKLAETAIPYAEKLLTGSGEEDITLIRVLKRTKGYKRAIDPSKQPTEQSATVPVSKGETEARQYLAEMAWKLGEKGIKVQEKVLIGDAAQQITYHVAHNPCDIIVMASHGRSKLGKLIRGSVFDKISRASVMPILMVRAPGFAPGI